MTSSMSQQPTNTAAQMVKCPQIALSVYCVAWHPLTTLCFQKTEPAGAEKCSAHWLQTEKASLEELLLPSQEPETIRFHWPNDDTLPVSSSHTSAQPCTNRPNAWFGLNIAFIMYKNVCCLLIVYKAYINSFRYPEEHLFRICIYRTFFTASMIRFFSLTNKKKFINNKILILSNYMKKSLPSRCRHALEK